MPKILLCPVCRSVVPNEEALRPKAFPFCSGRCRMNDLGRWLEGTYTIPQSIAEDDHEAIEEVLRAREAKS